MEYGTIEREVYVDAPAEVVFEVVSRPEHLRNWWPDDADFDPTPGSSGSIAFGDSDAGGALVGLTVVAAKPPHLFSFRWTQSVDEVARAGNSLLVTFELEPSGDGTRLRMTESGFREMGWEVAVLEEQYREHVQGWEHFLPRLVPYAEAQARGRRGRRAPRRHSRCGREPGDRRGRRRRPLVRDRRPDAASTARPAPPRRGRHGHDARAATARDASSRREAPRPARPGRARRGDTGGPREALPGRRRPAGAGRSTAGVCGVGVGRAAPTDQADRRGGPPRRGNRRRTDRLRQTRTRRTEMVDILHRVGVVTPSPEKVYDALTTVDGLAAWWTDDTRGSGEAGGRLEFRFPPVGGFDMEVLDVARPERVVWRVVDGPRRVGRHDDRLAAAPGRRLHDRALHACRLE